MTDVLVHILFAAALTFVLSQPLATAHAADADIEYGLPPFEWDKINLPLALVMNVTNDNADTDSKLATIHIGLHENSTGQPVSNASYLVTIRELQTNREIITDVFFAEEQARLELALFHGENEAASTKAAHREQFLNAWVPDIAGQPIAISSSELSQDKTYNIRVEILGMYGIKNVIQSEGEIPKADFVWDPASDSADKVLIVPEFGSIVPFVMAMTIAGIIAVKRAETTRQRRPV